MTETAPKVSGIPWIAGFGDYQRTRDIFDLPMALVAELGSFEGTSQELCALVEKQIKTYPETHDQDSWVSGSGIRVDTGERYRIACQTTLCVAGWAEAFTTGKIIAEDIAIRAAEKLGIPNSDDANTLFYHATDDQALKAIGMLARGEYEEFHSLMLESEALYLSW